MSNAQSWFEETSLLLDITDKKKLLLKSKSEQLIKSSYQSTSKTSLFGELK